MSADVISFWHCKQADRIRIPGPGEELPGPADVIILPCVRHERTPLAPTPTRK